MKSLARVPGGPRPLIKHDDRTASSSWGATRHELEFLMAEALARRTDVVIDQGGTRSNHARQTAAAAAHLGMCFHILLEDRTGSTAPSQELR